MDTICHRRWKKNSWSDPMKTLLNEQHQIYLCMHERHESPYICRPTANSHTQNLTQELHKNVTSRCHHGNEVNVNNENFFRHLHHAVGCWWKVFCFPQKYHWNKLMKLLHKVFLRVFFSFKIYKQGTSQLEENKISISLLIFNNSE